jgi:hypothetical protein
MYLEAGAEKLFAWNTTRHMGAEAQFSDRTKRILEVFHHKPTALASTARIGRSQHSLKPTSNHLVRSFQKHSCQNPAARWLQMEKGATSAYKPGSQLPRKGRALAEYLALPWRG